MQAQLARANSGRLPTIAVLAPSNALAASISEQLSEDRQAPDGTIRPAIDHELVWDPSLSAAAGFVVASILEWPTLPPADAITSTLRKIADFYRVKLADKKTDTARAAVTSIENSITRFVAGKNATHQHGKGDHLRVLQRPAAHRQSRGRLADRAGTAARVRSAG